MGFQGKSFCLTAASFCQHRRLLSLSYWVTQYLTSMVTNPGFKPQLLLLLLALGDASRLVVKTRSWMSDQSSIQEFDPLYKVAHSKTKYDIL